MSQGIILYPFEAEYPGELSVSENQTVFIIQQHDDGWTTVRLENEDDVESEGLVPTSYIKVLNLERRLPPKPPRKRSSISSLAMLQSEKEDYLSSNLYGGKNDYLKRYSYADISNQDFDLDLKEFSNNRQSFETSSQDKHQENFGNNEQWDHLGKNIILPQESKRQSVRFLQKSFSKSTLNQNYSLTSKKNEKDLKIIENAIVMSQRRKNWRELWSKNDSFKKRRTRIALIRETISTEETYVNNLELCMKIFGPLKGCEILLRGMQEIIQVNKELLAKMKLELDNFPMTFLGRIFKEMASKMVVYTEYINNYDKSFELYQQWVISNKKSFASQLNKIYKKNQIELGGKQLESYLILPVQRIPRYRLLLESILKNTNEEHVEYQDIKDALDDIMQLAKYIDDQKKLVEDSEAKSTLSRIVNEYSTYKGIGHNNRRLIRDGLLNVSCPNRGIFSPIKFKCYLMSDLLVFTDVIDPSVKKRNGRVDFIFMLVSKLVEETSTSFTLETYHMNEIIQIQFLSDIQGDCAVWCRDVKSSLESCEALYRLYESDVNLSKLASERPLFQEISKECMQNYAELKIQYSLQDREYDGLQQQIIEHENELRTLQEIIEQERIELNEMQKNKESIQNDCIYFEKRLTDCLENIRERDQLFLSLLRNEIDSFKVIFGDTPSENGMNDSTSKRISEQQSLFINRQRSVSIKP